MSRFKVIARFCEVALTNEYSSVERMNNFFVPYIDIKDFGFRNSEEYRRDTE